MGQPSCPTGEPVPIEIQVCLRPELGVLALKKHRRLGRHFVAGNEARGGGRGRLCDLGAQPGATMAPGGLEGLAASSTPTPRRGWSLLPIPAEDSRAGGPHSSSEPGLGARGSSWGRTTAPSPQLVQTGLGRVWPRQAAFQPSGSRLPQGLPKS